ncbi:MAG: hypothetical protein BWZ02_01739 [Lentisphaerae bacterium ADurb.BinA184]|nr:MAG: hypothetical protein BWZ02_01739 [Lentisphaerae bacterium ADurb.BinA184]
MLTGAPPFPGDDSQEVMRRHVQEPLTPVARCRPSVPVEVSEFVGELLRKDREGRPQTWREVSQRLEKLVATQAQQSSVAMPSREAATVRPRPVAVPRPAQSQRPRRTGAGVPLAMAVGILLALVLLIGVLLVVSRQRHRGGRPPGGPVQPSARTDWEALRVQLEKEKDPAACIRLLEDFRMNGGQGLPPAKYAQLMNGYLALLRPSPKVTEPPRPSPPPEPDPPPPPPPPPPPRPAPEPERAPPPDPAEQARRDRQRGDDFTELAYLFSRHRFAFNRPTAPLAAKANEWLAAHTEESPERARAAFLAGTLCPAADRLLAVLAANSARLAGNSLPGYEQERIKTVTDKGIETTIKVGGGAGSGTVTRPLPWSELDHAKMAGHLARLLHPVADLPLEDRRSLLAFAALQGSSAAVQEMLKPSVPPDEARLWQSVALDIENAGRDRSALDRLRGCREAVAGGERLAAWQGVQEVKSKPNVVRTRHAEELAAIEAACAPHVPEVKAARILAQARDALADTPERTLALLSVATGCYGRLPAVQDPAVKGVREQALARIMDILRKREVPPDVSVRLAALLPRPGRQFAGQARAELRLLDEDGLIPAGVRDQLRAFEGLTLIETGEWGEAREALQGLSYSGRFQLPSHLRTALLLGQGLIAARFQPTPSAPRSALEEMSKMPAQSGAYAVVQQSCAACELALATEQAEAAAALTWPDALTLARETGSSYAKRYLLMRFALLADAGESARAADFLSGFLDDQAVRTVFNDIGMREDEWSYLAQLRSGLRGEGSPPSFEAMPHLGWSEFYGLVTLAVAGGSERAGALLTMLDRLPAAPGPLTSRLRFDVLLGRLALAAGDPPEAGEALIGRALDGLDMGNVGGYPSLLALQAGLELRRGRPRVAAEVLGKIALSTVASDWERGLASALEGDAAARLTPADSLSDGKRGANELYWRTWLNVCHWLGQNHAVNAREQADILKRCATSPAKRRLAEALAAQARGPVAEK